MMQVTIGQYYPAQSVIHRLDARVKLVGTLVYITSLFFVTRYTGYCAAILFLAVLVRLSQVPFRYLLRGLRAVFMVIIFTAFLNVFFTPGEHVMFSFYFVRITWEGLALAGKMALRLILLITGSSVMTLTTSPIQLTDAIEYLMKPLKKIGVPVHEIAMMMTIALRFIPTLMEETDKIMKAQMARGADFDTGGLYKKAKSLIPILVPLFVSAFRRADELAAAMDARCYRGDENRTKMKVMKMGKADYKAIGCLAVFLTILLLTRLY